ncbi:MAG TPA: TolC family protein [Candidatus Hydrogenedentes bacterium]|nr:TolC family protein [Candidatus Hydrogenedentota bacterium]HOK88975.1 TolC family protein [Candidatus Hydrogenedentota bacterium]
MREAGMFRRAMCRVAWIAGIIAGAGICRGVEAAGNETGPDLLPPQPVVDAAAATPANAPALPTVDSGEAIRQGISADLIDLTELRRAVELEAPPGEVIRLSLKDAVCLALRQNPDIVVTAYEPLKAAADEFTVEGEFDPAVKSSWTHDRTSAIADQQIRRFAGISDVETWRSTFTTGLGGKLKTGTQYGLQFSADKFRSTFGNFVDEYTGQVILTLTQPLLRGAGTRVNTIRIRQARNARKISEAQLEATALKVTADVVKAYWDLVYATEAVKVRIESLKNAERLLEINETRQRIGTAADIEVLQAKAGVAARQSEVIAATSRARDAATLLKQYLGMREGELLSNATIIPTDRPAIKGDLPPVVQDLGEELDRAVKLALDRRPEMRMTELEIATAQLEADRTRNDMLPQIDLVGAYGQGGREYDLGGALRGILDRENFNYSVGVQGTIVLGNRAARGANLKARLAKKQAEARKRQTEMALMTAVHVALSNVHSSRVLVESARQTVRLQEANVAADEKRLRLGVATSFEVLRTQEDLANARQQELQAQVAYEKALVELRAAEGVLLDEMGVEFTSPESVEQLEPYTWWDSVDPWHE